MLIGYFPLICSLIGLDLEVPHLSQSGVWARLVGIDSWEMFKVNDWKELEYLQVQTFGHSGCNHSALTLNAFW